MCRSKKISAGAAPVEAPDSGGPYMGEPPAEHATLRLLRIWLIAGSHLPRRSPIMGSQGQQILPIQAVADIFARGYLRLTDKAKYDAISAPDDLQKELDVFATESPHVCQEVDRRTRT